MSERPLYFEIHIRPMFREIDFLHMKNGFGLDLWDYETVSKGVDHIIEYLTLNDPNQFMPRQDAGGPWPEEWIAVIKRWRDEYHAQRLPRGTGEFTVDRDGDTATLRVTGSPSARGASVWLERIPGRANPPEYILYEEPPKPGFDGSPDPFDDYDTFDVAGASSVYVTDRKGRRQIAIPA
jgi:hypothetical protein